MSSSYDLAAYFWPAYHDEERWRLFMPEGKGEWEITGRARPRFPGHYQPRLPLWGETDDADPREMERKLAAAADHGVNVFIFDWYWYEDQPFLEQSLERGYLGAGNRDRVRFFLMWANHDASTMWDYRRAHTDEVVWSGQVDATVFRHATERILERFLVLPGYYRIDDRPVFAIYDIANLIDGLGGVAAAREALDDFRARAVAVGLPGLHLQAIVWGRVPEMPGKDGARASSAATLDALGFDSRTHYQWVHHVRPTLPYGTWGEHGCGLWTKEAEASQLPFFPHVSIGWDTNARRPAFDPGVVRGASPDLYARFLERACDHVDRHGLPAPLITINAWNEWSEGSYLEPDQRFAMAYLEATAAVLRERNALR